ncbi:hypothetical protein FJY63_10855 [Candidatus Sumerlaeota bacterium]|nr:hypothetical protein [Candidatus Sumerlaeota bacterium]
MRSRVWQRLSVRTVWLAVALSSVALVSAGCQGLWRHRVRKEMPVMGHRNWVVIADSAYPAQSRSSIETVYTGSSQLRTVRYVLRVMDRMGHIRPNIYLDAELEHVADADARGIQDYRAQLRRLLGSRSVTTLPHEELIAKLDKAGEMFRVLILKTDMKLPYTSVFLELDCGYWGADAEARLREALKKAK